MNKKFKTIEFDNSSLQKNFGERKSRCKTFYKSHEVQVVNDKLNPTKKPVEPEIKIDKNGEIINQIEIICKCGERYIFELEYESDEENS